MEWRCTFCGKPHAEDDPPCDNCGHNKFERAVEQFNAETVPSDPIWVCTECGRQHQKNSPPCSRCGNVDLEKRQPDYDDLDELGGTSYLDVLEPKYVAGYVAVAVLGGVLLLAFVGVVSLPTLGGPPAPPDVPGNATTAGGVSLEDVERAYVDAVTADRRLEGEEFSTSGDVGALATYANRQSVDAVVEGSEPATPRTYVEDYGLECRAGDETYRPRAVSYAVADLPEGSSGGYESAETLAAAILDRAPPDAADDLDDSFYAEAGADVHAYDGRLFVTMAWC